MGREEGHGSGRSWGWIQLVNIVQNSRRTDIHLKMQWKAGKNVEPKKSIKKERKKE